MDIGSFQRLIVLFFADASRVTFLRYETTVILSNNHKAHTMGKLIQMKQDAPA